MLTQYFEVRDVGGYWLLHGKVFHKKVFDIVEEVEDMSLFRDCETIWGN